MMLGLLAVGCHRNVSAQNQANGLGPDPAAANMAPVDDSQAAQQGVAPAGQGTNEAITAAQTASPNDQQPTDQGYGNDQAVDQGQQALDNGDYDDAEAETDQTPPPLPDYSQPPIPGDGYMWTPGYWAWAPAGYYWVPGTWVMPPYQGALWTPCYWGWRGGRYYFYRGYWGPYIGYYGGINYGFGYGGRGYEGGYWRDHRFYYNRAVNNIRVTNITNVYVHNVTVVNTRRVSYNGPGGANLRPVPAELAAMRRNRVAPMTTQIQAQHAAAQNRAQFARVNNGRPAEMTAARPLPADRETRPMPPARIPTPQQRPVPGVGAGQPHPQSVQQRPGQPQNFARPTPGQPMSRPAPGNPGQQPGQQRPENLARPTPQQPEQRPVPQQRQEQFNRPAPAQPEQARPSAPQQNMARPTPQPQQRPEQFNRPTPQPEQRPAPQPMARPTPQPEQRPVPQPMARPTPQPAARPAPQPRPAPQARPAPPPRPAPAPHPAPAPQQNKDEHPH